MDAQFPKVIAAGEEAALIYLADQSGDTVLSSIQQLCANLEQAKPPWLVELVPSFTSLMVYYDVLQANFSQVQAQLNQLFENSGQAEGAAFGRTLQIPVYYGDEVAEDLGRVSEATGLSPEQIIQLHTSTDLRVYALGFRPGFGFMGSLPKQLRVPRLATPRQRVPKGAVAIAEAQAAVYPDVSPGGWNIIGRCPISMFNRRTNPPAPFLQVGDRVTFTAVGRSQFLELAEENGGEISL
ncbi:5-oxoprolinase subunit PxpB [Porticoccus sp. W117]|uniref:5-oxoprolinase subunit PxpB n=1 Tax=Porticoccus sp. W117 TaxID=3054777 RepID=UPI00259597F5|nr:5-oxoprolinase subunit PxpB [Porticoccus sp. W117]MDM3870100.1 5-oxoprolinase subunit PxpB [Porticoccus sp. W117]